MLSAGKYVLYTYLLNILQIYGNINNENSTQEFTSYLEPTHYPVFFSHFCPESRNIHFTFIPT